MKSFTEEFRDFGVYSDVFAQTAARAYEVSGDFDGAVETALLTTDVEVSIPDDLVGRLDRFVPDSLGATRRDIARLCSEHVETDGALELMRGVADVPLSVAEFQYDALRMAIIAAIEALPDEVPARALGPFLAEEIAGPMPLVIAQQQETFDRRDSSETEEGEVPPDDPEQEQKDEQVVPPLAIGGGAEALGKFLKEHPKLEALMEIILGAIGVEGLLEVATTDKRLLEIFEKLQKAIRAKDRKGIEKVLGVLIRYLKSKKFRKKVIDKFGIKGLKRFLAKLLGRAVPFLGWAVLVLSLIGLIWIKWDKLMDP